MEGVINVITPIFNMKKSLILLLLVSLSSAAKDSGNGTVSVIGQIQESACNIHLDDVFQALNFDNVEVNHIVTDNDEQVKDFAIRLVNCSIDRNKGTAWESVHISFDGMPDQQNTDLFSMTGEGSGIAVQIKDTNGQLITPGNRVNVAKVENGATTLAFKIKLVSNGEQLLIGSTSSTIKFTIEYQ